MDTLFTNVQRFSMAGGRRRRLEEKMKEERYAYDA